MLNIPKEIDWVITEYEEKKRIKWKRSSKEHSAPLAYMFQRK